MGYFSPNPITGQSNRSKRAVIPLTINAHTTPGSITATVDDPFTGTAGVALADGAGVLTDAVFAGTGLTGATPKIGVEVQDGNATRFRKGRIVCTDTAGAGNAPLFSVGVVQRGNGKKTANGHLQALVTLNGSINAAIAAGLKFELELEWD